MRKFAIAFATQRTEAILEGMAQAFEFFGCVPKEVWWDNPRTVADAVLSGRERKVNARYAALASHFAFEPHRGWFAPHGCLLVTGRRATY